MSISSVTSIPVIFEGMKILGIRAGGKEFTSKVGIDINFAEGGEELRQQVVNLNTQEEMLLRRHCRTPRMIFLLQGVQPDCLQFAAVIHDQQACSTFTQLQYMHNADISDEKWMQATLPISVRRIQFDFLREIAFTLSSASIPVTF